jgi:hypothetical protein
VPTSWIRPPGDPGVATAGGFTERAASNRTEVIRIHVDGRQETIVIDLNEVVSAVARNDNLLFIANEVLVVPQLLLVACAPGTVLAERTTSLPGGWCAA